MRSLKAPPESYSVLGSRNGWAWPIRVRGAALICLAVPLAPLAHLAHLAHLADRAPHAPRAPTAVHVGAAIDVDPSGRVHFIDTARDRIWRIELDGALTVVAHGAHANRLVIGPNSTFHYPPDSVALGDFALWNSRAPGTQQDYDYFLDFIAMANDGSLYRSRGNRVLRQLRDGSVAVLAGDTVPGYADGPASSARFDRLLGLAVDSAGSVYVADYGNRRVRKISSDGAVTTVARIPWPWRPTGLAIWRDRVYLLERWGDYPGAPPIPWFISSYSFFADLLGHPRVRLIEPDGQSPVIASIASTRIRLGVALSTLVGFASLFLWIRLRGSRRA